MSAHIGSTIVNELNQPVTTALDGAIRRLFVDANISENSSANLDAFGRLRTSEPFTLFDSKQLADSGPLLWTQKTTGTASFSYNTNQASSDLSVGAGAGVAINQTRRRFVYQPGKSQLIFMTFTLRASVAGTVKRVGLFDEQNGLFLEQNGTDGLRFAERSYTSGSAVTTYAERSTWDDPMDGSGASGLNLAVENSLILVVDFEWLGVGTVRYGFVINGKLYWAHCTHHSNLTVGVYMSNPNLPVRYEIDGTSSSSLEAICSTVISEGGRPNVGILRSADTEFNPLIFSTNNAHRAFIGLRLKATHLWTNVLMHLVNIVAITSANFHWSVYFNPTLASGLTWTAVPNSAVEVGYPGVALGLSGGTEIGLTTGDIQIASGYGSSNAGSTVISSASSELKLGSDVDGTPDELVLMVGKFSGGNESFAGSMQWLEAI